MTVIANIFQHINKHIDLFDEHANEIEKFIYYIKIYWFFYVDCFGSIIFKFIGSFLWMSV